MGFIYSSIGLQLQFSVNKVQTCFHSSDQLERGVTKYSNAWALTKRLIAHTVKC